VKGNGWLVEINTGVDSPRDGFQVHEIEDGWGRGNRFAGSVDAVNGSGYGFMVPEEPGNPVGCDNEVTGADYGFANVPCAK